MSIRAILMLLILPGSAFAEAVETVEQILQKASLAVQEQNYRGKYTYDAGSGLETLEIIHGVIDGIEHERVFHLNGNKRDFIRLGRSVNCVSAGNFLLRGGLVAQASGEVGLPSNYHFYIRGDERIAGRMASVVQITPKDQFRYGYILAIDKNSYLPLLAITMADGRTAVERFQAVDITIGDYDTSDLQALAEHENKALSFVDTPCGEVSEPSTAWRPRWVPTGFVMSHGRETKRFEDSLTYTDGLSSFTVFLKAVEDKNQLRNGSAQKGATSAVLAGGASDTGLYQVVLIGEIPAQTAQRVVSSINLASPH